jgi:DNA replication licensing factor MCM5
VFGRYDDFKSASENIDLMTTSKSLPNLKEIRVSRLTFVIVYPKVLSRFDMIFLVRDVRDEDRDRLICKHVMGVHIENSESGRDTREGDIFEDSRYA